MDRSRSCAAVLILLANLATVGCADGEHSGTVTLNYQLGIGSACEAFGVARVHAELGDGVAEDEVDCDPAQPIMFDAVPTGRHTVLVQGLDAEGDAVMDNLDVPHDDELVEVIGGSARSLNVNLAPAPALVQIRWVVAIDGQPTNCEFVGPQRFRVRARKQMGAKVMLEHEFPCAVAPGYQPVPDPERIIDGTTLDGITVDMLGADGTSLDTVTFLLDSPPGPGKAVKIDVHCDGTKEAPVCTGTIMTPEGTGSSPGGESGGNSGGEESTSAGGTTSGEGATTGG